MSGTHAYWNVPNKLASSCGPGDLLGTILEVSKLHCQPSRQPLVETCPGMDDRTGKNWKTKEHMGLANTNALPMEMLGRMEHNSNADRCMAGTYRFLG